MKRIFIEAESFTRKGGWVIDTLSMEVIHSAYLMAHGMGVPVEDATTDFSIDEEGEYCVWVLTRDWTAVWNVTDSAGKFQVLIDGIELAETLGTKGSDWAWQLAGKVRLSQGVHQMALHDLTGFNGRCDAIYITNSAEVPSNQICEIDKMRQELNWKEFVELPETYDLVVVGGGVAGICMALSAIRSGVKTALIHDRSVLGGCNSSEVRVCMGGQIKLKPYERLGDVVREIAPVFGRPTTYKADYYEDSRKLYAFESANKKLYSLMLNEAVSDIEQNEQGITAVICTNTVTGKRVVVRGSLFADCSGDAVLARLAGAEVMYGNDAKADFGEELAPIQHKKLVMGHSIRWYSREEETETVFPDLDWNLHFDEKTYLNCFSGDWEQETGFTRDMVSEAEYIRDYGLRAIYSNWSFQKNHCQEKERFAKSKLQWVSPIGGKREGYRVKGDYILRQQDLLKEIVHEDATARITWGIDIHYPEPMNEEAFGEAFRSFAYHKGITASAAVPYRCLYSKDIPNLFLGGRIISASHVAFSAVRVMRTLGMLGEVVGLAAGICKLHACNPRDVYESHLPELKERMAQGVCIPTVFCGGSIEGREEYHFKDIGWWSLHSGKCRDNFHQGRVPSQEEIDKFLYCVKALGINHEYEIPKNWEQD